VPLMPATPLFNRQPDSPALFWHVSMFLVRGSSCACHGLVRQASFAAEISRQSPPSSSAVVLHRRTPLDQRRHIRDIPVVDYLPLFCMISADVHEGLVLPFSSLLNTVLESS